MDAAVIDRIAARVARAVTSGEAVTPLALRLLLRRFIASDDAFREPLALALGADRPDEAVDPERLQLLAEALAVSDDDGLRQTVARQASAMSSTWPNRGTVAAAARSVDACLAAGSALATESVVVAGIDELERVIGLSYEPGDGVAQRLSTRTRSTGDLATHAAVASALLHGYDVTGRPAYPMLAEELIWSALNGEPSPSLSLAGFETAGILSRLAALQRDAEYRAAAVTRGDTDYRVIAERWLADVDAHDALPLALAAAYAFAVDEWFRVT